MVEIDILSSEEREVTNILISIICLYGDEGLPLSKVNEQFQIYCGCVVPYEKFGFQDLKSFVLTLPEIYILTDNDGDEYLIEQSQKSSHIKELILKQKNRPLKRKCAVSTTSLCSGKRPRYYEKFRNAYDGSYYEFDISTDSERLQKFEQLESMLPLFYKHQALGDDFFLDIADTKMGYYVPEHGPKEYGLCAASQTISELTAKVQKAADLAPRVVVMIGFQDLLYGTNVNLMIYDLRQLIIELKKKNTRTTLITLIPSPKLPKLKKLHKRMEVFNNAILDYANDEDLKCSVIDMYGVFDEEAQAFRRDFERFEKVAKKDCYKVFSDYGRKIFMATLKTYLKEQIEYGH